MGPDRTPRRRYISNGGRVKKGQKMLECGSCQKKKPDVSWREDPYQADVNNDNSEYLLCNECTQNHADDI
jgi:hypothetical protein